MAMSKFRKTVTPPAHVKKERKGRWEGIEIREKRPDMPHVGCYRFRVVALTEGFNEGTGTESVKAQLEIVEIFDGGAQHEVGEHVTMIQLVSGKGGPAGMARTKDFVITAAGFESCEEYDEYDPKGKFIDACLGIDNEFSADAEAFVGRLVDSQVTRGRDTGKGEDYFREYEWAVVPEEEQWSK